MSLRHLRFFPHGLTVLPLVLALACVSPAQQARDLYGRGEIAASQALLRETIEADPDDLDARREWARQAVAEEDWQVAAQQWREILYLAPTATGWRSLQAALEGRGHWIEAAHAALEARSLGDEGADEALRVLVRKAVSSALRAGDDDAALGVYRDLVEVAPQVAASEAALAAAAWGARAGRLEGLGQMEGAAAAWAEAGELEPAEREHRVKQGLALLKARRFREAETALEAYVQAFSAGSGQSGASRKVARLLLDSDAVELALRFQRKAVSWSSAPPETWLELVEPHLRMRDLVGARRATQEFLSRSGYPEAGFLAAADALRRWGAPRLELEVLEDAHRRLGSGFDLLERLCSLYVTKGQRQRARSLMKAYLEETTSGEKEAFSVGTWAAANDEQALAIAAYERVAGLNSSRTTVYLRLAELYRLTGNPGEAERNLQRYIKASPDPIPALRTVAEHLRKQRRYTDAATQIEKALELRKGDAALWRELARIHREARQPAREEESYHALVQASPRPVRELLAVGEEYRRRGDHGRAVLFLQRAGAHEGASSTEREAALLALGELYRRQRKWTEMRAVDRRLVDLASDSEARVVALERLAQRYRKQRLWDDERWAIRGQLRIDDQRAELHLRLGAVDLQRRDKEAAASSFRRFVDLSDDEVEALHQVAQLYQRNKDVEAALATYRRIRAVAPGDGRFLRYTADLYRAQGADERAKALYDKLLQRPDARDLDLAHLGHTLYLARYWGQAAVAYGLLLKEGPREGIYAFELGECQLHLGKVAEAKLTFDAYLAGEKADPRAHMEVARRFRDHGHYALALALYRPVLRSGGVETDEAFVEASDLLLRTADTDALKVWVREYVKHARNELRAREQAGTSLGRAGLEEEAIAEWRHVLRLRPTHGRALEQLVSLLASMGRIDEAAQHMERLIEEAGGRGDHWRSAADAMKARAAYGLALRFYGRAIEAGSAAQPVRFARAECLLALGRWQEAAEGLEKILDTSHSKRQIAQRIGTLLEEYERYDEALQIWRRAVAVDAGHAPHHERLVAALLRRADWKGSRRALVFARASAPASLYAIARGFEGHGDSATAARIYSEVLELGLGQHLKEAFEGLLRLQLESGAEPAAHATVDRFVAVARDRARAHEFIAKLLAEFGRFAEAVAHARIALAERVSPEVLSDLARYALMAGRDEQALNAMMRGVEHADEAREEVALRRVSELVQRGRPELAEALVERLGQRSLAPLTVSLFALDRDLTAGRVPSALAAMDEFIASREDGALAARQLATVLRRHGMFLEASALLERALQSEDARPDWLLELAAVAYEGGQTSEGEAALERYRTSRAGQVAEEQLALDLGAILYGAGQLKPAIRSLRRAVSHPKAEQARRALRWWVLALSSLGQQARIAGAARTFLEARPNRQKAYVALSRTLLELDPLELAQKILSEALALFPNEGHLVDYAVATHVRAGTSAGQTHAIKRFLQAEGQPRQRRLADLARWFDQELRFAQSVANWEQLVDLAPGANFVLRDAARALWLDGRGARATEALQRYVDTHGDPSTARLKAAMAALGVARTGLGVPVGVDTARALAVAYLKDRPGDARGWFARLVADLQSGQSDGQAVERYLQAAAAKERSAIWAARRMLKEGLRLELGGTWATGEPTFLRIREVLAHAGDAPDARFWLSICDVLQRRKDAAGTLLQRLDGLPLSPRSDYLDGRRALPPYAAIAVDALLVGGDGEAARRAASVWVARAEDPEEALRALFDLFRVREAGAGLQWVLDTLDQRYPSHPSRVTFLAETLEVLGDPSGAERAYRLALEKNPDAGVYMNNLAYFLGRRGEKLEEALTLVRRAMDLQPQSNKYYLDTEGWVLYRLGRKEEARRQIEASIARMDGRQGGGVSESFYHLGVVYRDLGMTAPARRAFQKGALLDPAGRYGRICKENWQQMAP